MSGEKTGVVRDFQGKLCGMYMFCAMANHDEGVEKIVLFPVQARERKGKELGKEVCRGSELERKGEMCMC